MRRRLRRRRPSHIQGPTLCGFWGLFEEDRGDPRTPAPYATVAPSYVGSSMLPFRCPGCGEVPQALACPRTRECYRDTRPGRGNLWCPLCGCRFNLDERGVPLDTALPAGAVVGPSRVTRGGEVSWQDRGGVFDSTIGMVLGALGVLPSRESGRGYAVLARNRRPR